MIEMADSEKDLGVQISVAWYSGTLRTEKLTAKITISRSYWSIISQSA